MRGKELYQVILGLEPPWTVSGVDLNAESSEIRVQVCHPRGTQFRCPECQREFLCYDHAPD